MHPVLPQFRGMYPSRRVRTRVSNRGRTNSVAAHEILSRTRTHITILATEESGTLHTPSVVMDRLRSSRRSAHVVGFRLSETKPLGLVPPTLQEDGRVQEARIVRD